WRDSSGYVMGPW
nr:Chain C, peptide ligand [synthetic construct]4IIM_D Chain D, peptide ligand [synthetic construct]4IIM_E Chain E, peptide ligand [synthetic construct]